MVLPEPDSPTTPSVCPLRTMASTPSTALMCPTVLRKKPRLMGNHTFRPLVSSTVGAEGSLGGGAPLGSAVISILV